jgi:glycosyltransferase involved in cell wall biosynthesis
MRLLVWHVHGSWTTAFTQGSHDYLVPVLPGRPADGRGRAQTWDWPASVVERTPEELAAEQVDAVVLQRPHELALVEEWLGRRPGVDVPAVYVEHNTPGGDVPYTRHPLADRTDIPVAHVTAFNAQMWDCGKAPTTVVDHGIVDPGHQWTGDLPHVGACINDPVRRGRAVGTDLALDLTDVAPVELFGINAELVEHPRVHVHESPPQDLMHQALARCGAYAHTARWTSLGLSLLEAMHLGMPVVALGATEAFRAVPPGTGLLADGPAALRDGVRRLLDDRPLAEELGAAARVHALERYGLARFLADWDELLGSLG